MCLTRTYISPYQCTHQEEVAFHVKTMLMRLVIEPLFGNDTFPWKLEIRSHIIR